MNRRFAFLALALSAALAGAACGGAATVAPASGSGDTAAHLVVALQGNLSVKRLGWSDYAPAVFGMALRNGDLLRVEGGGKATVACADLTLANPGSGVSSVPCKVAKPLLTYGDSLIVPTRAEPPVGAPVILSPRKTKVLAARPLLRWAPVAGAQTYDVSVRGGSLSWSTRVSGATELVYPADAPALQPGVSYKLSVSAAGRSSDEETEPGLGFSVLKADEAQTVQAAEARVRSLGLADAATRLLIANLYAGQGLNAEAIDILRDVARSANEPAVTRTLGDLFLKTSQTRLAEEAFLAAADLSTRAGDIEGMAASHSALGLVYETFGNKAQAIEQCNQAIASYQRLGDSKTVKQIQERLASLQK